jgi:citrate lyase subunit beta/citryl-CoA lyase
MTEMPDDTWPLRSMLFVPGHKPDWVRKAHRSQPDALILDLEDSVPQAGKEAARGIVQESIAWCRSEGLAATVRINHPAQGGFDDIQAITMPGLVAIVVPKTRSADEIAAIDRALCHAEGRAGMPMGSVAILPLPETAEGLRDTAAIAGASARVKGLFSGFTGTIIGDVAWAAGFKPTPDGLEQMYLASKVVLDSRAAGALHSICSIVGTAIDDHALVERLAIRGRQFGFAGCALIHPSHVAIANRVFTPTAEEIDYASGLVAAMEEGVKAGSAAVLYRGMMVDYAMVPSARQTLRDAARRGPAKG